MGHLLVQLSDKNAPQGIIPNTEPSTSVVYAPKGSARSAYTYGMRWKAVRNAEYLFRDRDRHGNGKSLGPRSEKTEALLAAFTAGREAAQERLRLITEKIDEQARLNKALRLNRVPRVVARVLRELDRAGLYEEFMVIGTQALYAYEAAGGAHLQTELFSDERHRLFVLSNKTDEICLRGDKARRCHVTVLDSDSIEFQVLQSLPTLDVVCIDEDGWPVPMRVPDQRAFALHKAWLSSLPTRETLKKPRDLDQAQAVASLLKEQMPHLSFENALTSLHGDVRNMLPLLIA